MTKTKVIIQSKGVEITEWKVRYQLKQTLHALLTLKFSRKMLCCACGGISCLFIYLFFSQRLIRVVKQLYPLFHALTSAFVILLRHPLCLFRV